jgi:hypothetical protein
MAGPHRTMLFNCFAMQIVPFLRTPCEISPKIETMQKVESVPFGPCTINCSQQCTARANQYCPPSANITHNQHLHLSRQVLGFPFPSSHSFAAKAPISYTRVQHSIPSLSHMNPKNIFYS